eukprot:TRINITY_DN7164_c0_g1_i1.p1 TRINITY_DN7164_c0_g1~~TRINITY_DN7164_c0_g1_i1.p1  ORF type:complete len:192 (-),score=19.54 TRINITY_DN7164_c0_g1_i1:64-639(-)
MSRLKLATRLPQIKRRASNAWTAVQDTFFSTKDVFERHRVVFTIGTSIASVATAWAGYSLRYLHQSKVEQRLECIEKAMTNIHQVEQEEIKKIVSHGTLSYSTCATTAALSVLVGYGLGWRSGRWYTVRVFQRQKNKEQNKLQLSKLQGLSKIQQWQILNKSFLRRRAQSNVNESRIPHLDSPKYTEAKSL